VSGNRRKGTAVSKTYRKTSRRAQPDPLPGEVTVQEQLVVSIAEIDLDLVAFMVDEAH
jgi:hypothetical protein